MKIIRCATIGLSLNIFCKGILQDLKKQGYEVVALSSPDYDLAELGSREQVKTIGVEMDRHQPDERSEGFMEVVSCLPKREA